MMLLIFICNKCFDSYYNVWWCSSSSSIEERGLAEWISAFFLFFLLCMYNGISGKYTKHSRGSQKRCLLSVPREFSKLVSDRFSKPDKSKIYKADWRTSIFQKFPSLFCFVPKQDKLGIYQVKKCCIAYAFLYINSFQQEKILLQLKRTQLCIYPTPPPIFLHCQQRVVEYADCTSTKE